MDIKDNLPVLQKQAAPVLSKVLELVIKTPKDMEEAVLMRETLKKIEKTVKADKEKITAPLNAALKEVRSRYVEIESNVAGSLTVVNKKMSDYQTVEAARADVELAKVAARVGEGRGKLKPETAVQKMSQVDKPADVVSSTAGSTAFVSVRKFEVVDFAALPDEFKVQNDVKIREAMRAGTPVAGVKYFTVQEPRSK